MRGILLNVQVGKTIRNPSPSKVAKLLDAAALGTTAPTVDPTAIIRRPNLPTAEYAETGPTAVQLGKPELHYPPCNAPYLSSTYLILS
jgi:hypothetical protein